MIAYAHSKENAPLSEWQLLEAHLEGTAKRAEIFAAPFSSSTFGWLIGLLHDIGKSRSGFQSYLRRCNDEEEENPDYGDHAHAIVGACYLNHTKSLDNLQRRLPIVLQGIMQDSRIGLAAKLLMVHLWFVLQKSQRFLRR